jgi:hypothetical protein
MLGLAAFKLFTPAWRCVQTGKLVHAPNYRSLFRPGPVRPLTPQPSTAVTTAR